MVGFLGSCSGCAFGCLPEFAGWSWLRGVGALAFDEVAVDGFEVFGPVAVGAAVPFAEGGSDGGVVCALVGELVDLGGEALVGGSGVGLADGA